jgi:hypothetical protein
MTQATCIICETSISEISNFCFNCGTRIKCPECESPLLKEAKFCFKCGIKVESITDRKSTEKNTVIYRRTNDEIFCEVSLNDDVAKEGINGLINNLTNTSNVEYKKINNSSNPTKINITAKEEMTDIPVESNDPSDSKDEIKTEKPISQFPHINDVEINIECSESEWILVYAFYCSDFGKKTFTKTEAHDKYMAKRKTDSRVGNFSTNWKSLFKEYISTVNDTSFKFKAEKIDFIRDLILGKEKSKNLSKGGSAIKKNKTEKIEVGTKTKKPVSSNGATYSIDRNLNLIPKGKQSLNDFYNQYISKNHQDYILIFVYYLEKIANEKNISEDKIYTCYKNSSLPVPNIKKVLSNIVTRKGWINSLTYSDLKVSVAGENHIEHKMTKK